MRSCSWLPACSTLVRDEPSRSSFLLASEAYDAERLCNLSQYIRKLRPPHTTHPSHLRCNAEYAEEEESQEEPQEGRYQEVTIARQHLIAISRHGQRCRLWSRGNQHCQRKRLHHCLGAFNVFCSVRRPTLRQLLGWWPDPSPPFLRRALRWHAMTAHHKQPSSTSPASTSSSLLRLSLPALRCHTTASWPWSCSSTTILPASPP